MALTINLDNIDAAATELPTQTTGFTTTPTNWERDRNVKAEAKRRNILKKVTGSFRDIHGEWLNEWETKLGIKTPQR